MFSLTGKNALVTGATGGLGGAIARALHGRGATVAISGRQIDKLETLAAELKERVHVVPCDLADKAQVAGLVDAAIKKLGRLDILVNNAGLTKDNLFMVMKDEQWDDVIAVNLTSTFMLMRAATRAMLARQDRLWPDHQYFFGLGHRRQPRPRQLCGLKGRYDRHDKIAGPRGRRARHHRQLHRARLHLDADDGCADRAADGDRKSRNSCAEIGTPDDIAAAAVYLASTEAAYVTGQTLHVNGGMVMM